MTRILNSVNEQLFHCLEAYDEISDTRTKLRTISNNDC